MAVDWSRGYSAQWRVMEVDPVTWADGASLPGARSASVERDWTSDAPTLESGGIDLDADPGEGFRERYVRLAMVASQGGERERVDVATLLCSSTGGKVSRGNEALKVTGRSVLWPASKTLLARGSYAPRGADGAQLAGQMLSSAIQAPVIVTGGFVLEQHVVYDMGSSVLAAAWLIVRAGNHRIRIDGRGRVYVEPVPSEPSLLLDRAHARLLQPDVERELDWSDVPNRYTSIDGTRVATAVNDDPLSVTSTAYRGWTHDVVDRSPIRVDGETLDGYANRRLAELSVAEDSRTYKREWWPDVVPGDMVRGSIASVGIVGDLRVRRQSLACGNGIVVTERSAMEVRSWPI